MPDRHPEEFRSQRFHGREPDPYSLVPQGGGDHTGNHRCPGEWATLAMIGVALDVLAGELRWEVPHQDLRVDLARIPTQPASGVVIRSVRPRS